MPGFGGTFSCAIDEKGRLSIPSKIRLGKADPQKKKTRRGIPAGEMMVLTQGLDGCLSLYPEDEWAKIEKRLDTLPFTQGDFRYFNRRLHQYSSHVRIDSAGRILIPDPLRQLVGLQKEVLVVGVNQSIEIWDPAHYQAYLDNYGRTYEEVAERLFRNDTGQ